MTGCKETIDLARVLTGLKYDKCMDDSRQEKVSRALKTGQTAGTWAVTAKKNVIGLNSIFRSLWLLRQVHEYSWKIGIFFFFF